MNTPAALSLKAQSTLHRINHLPLPRRFFVVALALALGWFTLPKTVQAEPLGTNTADGDFSLATIKINGAGTANNNTAIGYTALTSDTADGNTAVGSRALFSNTTASENTATGFQALFSNTTGQFNTATGAEALVNNNGGENTATGYQALFSNTSGTLNTATGYVSLGKNTAGTANTATGAFALFSNTTGQDNTAYGFSALGGNTTGAENTATGDNALGKNTTGTQNTATGASALTSNTTGNLNTATGEAALFSNTTGKFNTATGLNALSHNTTGISNTATGLGALQNNNASNNTATGVSALSSNKSGGNNTAEGFQALENSTGSNNIAVGSNAGVNLTTGSNNIDIGAAGAAGESAKIRIGKQGTQNGTFIAGIHGVTLANTLQVVVDVNGHLGTVGSSERFKEAIKPMDKASEAILSLQPVTFRYKQELDPDGIPQFGLVAEQVEKVNPNLVVRDNNGEIYTVRYEAVNAMLLNEFLKEHRKVKEQEGEIAQMKNQIEALTATVQKVSDQIALSTPAPQLVANP
jgi:hypothetical protein